MSGVTLLEELKVAAQLKAWHEGHKGSLLDYSGNGITLTTTTEGSGQTWGECPYGLGMAGTAASSYLGGTAAVLDLTTATTFAALWYFQSPAANPNHSLLAKGDGLAALTNGYHMYISAGSASFSLGDAGAFQAFGYATLTPGGLYLLANSFNGTTITSFRNGAQVDSRAQTRVPSSVGKNYRYGWTASYGLHDVVLVKAGVVNRVLTPAEHARLWTDLLSDRYPKNLARRNFVSFYQSKSNAEYAAAGIAVDTDLGFEMSGSTRRIRDLTTKYPGTLGGTIVPGDKDGGATFYTGVDSHGDVTELNSATKFNIEGVIRANEASISANAVLYVKQNAATTQIMLQLGGGNPSSVYAFVCNGANTYGRRDLAVRPQQEHHYMVNFDGGQNTDDTRLKLFLDGEQTVFSAMSGPIPAALPDLATKPLYYGAYNTTPLFPFLHTGRMFRVRNTSLTPTQARDAYLSNFAKKLIRRETLEDVPVTLTASVAAGDKIGPWNVTADTWASVEATTGKRSLKHIGNGTGVLTNTSTAAFGTWRFRLKPSAVSIQEHFCMFIGSVPGWYNAAGQNGYMIYLNVNQAYLFAITGGGTASIASTAAGTIALGTEYEFIVNRRPSDGRFFVYAKGGIWTDWTLIMTAAHPTHLSSNYVNLGSILRQDEFPLYDPADTNVGYFVYQGQLNPMMGGEIPGTSPINLLRWSEQFDNPSWVTSNVSVTPNAAASPFGQPNSADLLTASAAGYVVQTVTGVMPSAPYTYSVYVRRSAGTNLRLLIYDNAVDQVTATFNTLTGALVSLTPGTYGNTSAWSEDMGGGWWRLCVSGVQPAGRTSLQVYASFPSPNDAMYMWGADLTQGPCASRYVETQ